MRFSTLLRKKKKTVVEKAMCQAVATVSTMKGFTHMTPCEVYAWLEARGRRLFS